MAVRNRPVKIRTVDPSGEFVRGRPPLSTGIAVKLPSMDVRLHAFPIARLPRLAPIFS
jgi:hypothetical protein